MSTRDLFTSRRVALPILSADFARLGEQVDEVLAAGARVIHVDVMDGHFVPPITIGPLIAGAIADRVHDGGGAPGRAPDDRAPGRADRGLRRGRPRLHHDPRGGRPARTGRWRRSGRPLAGLAINPGTAVEVNRDAAPGCDLLLAMSVNPGWGGQSFIPTSPGKVERPPRSRPDGCAIEIDGGIDWGPPRRRWTPAPQPAGRGLGRLRRSRPGRGLHPDRRGGGRGVGQARPPQRLVPRPFRAVAAGRAARLRPLPTRRGRSAGGRGAVLAAQPNPASAGGFRPRRAVGHGVAPVRQSDQRAGRVAPYPQPGGDRDALQLLRPPRIAVVRGAAASREHPGCAAIGDAAAARPTGRCASVR